MATLKLWTAALVVASSTLAMPGRERRTPQRPEWDALKAMADSIEYPWAAIGDSFSAGPGAGSAFGEEPNECFRNDGSYPAQLNNDFPFPDNGMQFLSCTGAVADDMIATQLPDMDKDQQVVTLSIGGNDVGFGKILKACVFKPGGPFSDDCDTTIANTRSWLDDDKFQEVLQKAYDSLFERLDSGWERIVLVQLYPSFFAEGDGTEWCNEQTMGIVPGYKPTLTNALRHQLNRLAEYVDDEIKRFINRYNGELPYTSPRIYYMDAYDQDTYPGHRFCEAGRETLDDPDIWFFTIGGNDSPTEVQGIKILEEYDPETCAEDSKYDTDFSFGWYCDTAKYVASLPEGEREEFHTFAPESITKAFHPKTAAFTSIKDHHKAAIRRFGYPRGLSVDDGKLQCKPQGRDQDDERYFTTREDIVRATEEFCDSTHSSGVPPGLIEGNYRHMVVSMVKDSDGTDCPELDVTADDFVDTCRSAFLKSIDRCKLFPPIHRPLEHTSEPESERLTYGDLPNTGDAVRLKELWKQGGAYTRDCITWYVGRDPNYRPTLQNASATDALY